MISRRSVLVRMAVLFAAILVFLVPSASVRAGTGGNEDIGGSVLTSPHYYYNPRYIVDPSSSGPDIAAIKYAGPSNMKLGAHDCAGGNLDSSHYINNSYYVGIVGDEATYGGEQFCLFTEAGSTGSTSTFSANLDWD